MDIFYRILWYEDQEDWYKSMKSAVEDAIKDFELIPIIDFKKTPAINIDEIEKNNYDLILVDYNLSNSKNGVNGDRVIEQIRNGKIYTDVIFYSEHEEKLKKIFTQKWLEGVYVARREKRQFIKKINDITNKNLRRSISPSNLRGIVMDNTSEFDAEIKEIIIKAWQLLDEERKKEIDEYIKNDILKSALETTKENYNKYMQREDMIINDVLQDNIFDSNKKARLLNRFMKLDEDFCKVLKDIFKKHVETEQNFCDSYNNEIIKYRNALAHAEKQQAENDIYIGKHDGQDIEFNKQLCDKIRQNLIKYYYLFEELYNYIENM